MSNRAVNCEIHNGGALEMLRTLPDASVQCVVTSPPYWNLRDCKVAGQIGLEATLGEFIAKTVAVFREVRRVLKNDGICWVNMGDSYASSASGMPQGGLHASSDASSPRRNPRKKQSQAHTPPRGVIGGFRTKELVGQPWRLAFALQDDGWLLRQDIVWSKPAPMPESVRDRCTKRNRRSVWSIAAEPCPDAHFATFPSEIPRRCILVSTRPGDTVLDPFGGSGTTGKVALELGRSAVLIELNPKYVELIRRNLRTVTPGLAL